MHNTTVLGYYTFSPENLKKLFGTNYSPPNKFYSKLQTYIQDLTKSGFDPSKPNFNNANLESFPEDFQIYDHGCKNLTEFLRKVSDVYAKPIAEKLIRFVQDSPGEIKYPTQKLVLQPGWVFYPFDGSSPQVGVPPQGEVYILDTETFVQGFPTKYCPPLEQIKNPKKEGVYGFAAPVIATATDIYGNYLWMHKNLTEERVDKPWEVELVSIPERESIVLCYNSSYDLSRIENTYTLEDTKIQYFDLMSACISLAGMSGDQKVIAKKLIKENKSLPAFARAGMKDNKLITAYNLFTGKSNPQSQYNFFDIEEEEDELTEADKELREFFVQMQSLRSLWENLEEMLEYSIKDSIYTTELALKVIPQYIENQDLLFPLYTHCVVAHSRFAIREEYWQKFLEHSEDKFFELMEEQSELFDLVADEIYTRYKDGIITLEEIAENPWLNKLNWKPSAKPKTIKVKKYDALDKNKNVVIRDIELIGNQKLKDLQEELISQNPLVHKLKKTGEETRTKYPDGWDVPAWYIDRITKGTLELTTRKQSSHYLLGLRYKGLPIEYVKGEGWINTKGMKPVHKKGVGINVGVCLSNDQYQWFEAGDWTSDDFQEYLERFFQISELTSFWASTRKRALDKHVHKGIMQGEYIPIQTITGRAGSTLWSVVPDPQENKIGSDFKNVIKARDGYKLVGTDFSSQEALIFAIFGDGWENGGEGLFSCTPAGYMIATGDKDVDPPSDIHSVVARRANIPRGLAKGLNYALQFGGAKKRCADIFLQGNPELSKEAALSMASDFIDDMKGEMVINDYINSSSSYIYKNGKASDCFNLLMQRGDRDIQTFPLSGAKYSKALWRKHTGKNFLLTRNNLQIQGTGRNLLDVVILLCKYWCDEFGIDARFAMSVHDSFVYEVKAEQVITFTAIAQMAHLFAYAALRERLGIKEIGLAGSWFEGFEVGDFFMKSVKSNIQTPFLKDNPDLFTPGDRKLVSFHESLNFPRKIKENKDTAN